MAYKIVNAWKRKDGSYGWRVVFARWNPQNKKTVIEHVSQTDWGRLGIRKEMTREQAELQCAAINAQDKQEKKEEKIRRSIERIKNQKQAESAWLPPDIVRTFESAVMVDFAIRPVVWNLAKKLIIEVDASPTEWVWRSNAFHQLLIKRAISEDTAQRVWKALKVYCNYFCDRMGKQQFQEMPNIPPRIMGAIKDAYWEKKGDKFSILPMTGELLTKCKQNLSQEHARYFEIAYYFGLRSDEMDRIKKGPNPRSWFITEGDGRGFAWALHVYQKKLEKRGIPEAQRWKAIPACEPEQIALRKAIEKQDFKIPVNLRYVQEKVGARIKLRSPRRGFRKWLMVERGYSKRIASVWLGHIQPDTKTADEHYGGENYVEFEPSSKKKAS